MHICLADRRAASYGLRAKDRGKSRRYHAQPLPATFFWRDPTRKTNTKNLPPSTSSTLFLPSPLGHRENPKGRCPWRSQGNPLGVVERVPKLPRPDTPSGLCSLGDSPRSPSAYDLASPAHWRVPRRQLSQQQPENKERSQMKAEYQDVY